MRRPSLSLDRLESRTVPTTITVTSLNDSGAGTLRAALAQADALPGKDTVVFKLQPVPGPYVIDLASELTSKGNVAIIGPGAGTLAIDGQGNSRVFNIGDGSTTTDSPTAISGLSIIDGNTGGVGGGIFSTESFSLTGVVLSGNSAAQGGAVFVLGDAGAKSVTISKSQVFGNSASGSDGGLALIDMTAVKISQSTISGNTAAAGGAGGVYASLGGMGTGISVSGCAITDNSAGYGGGMILKDGSTVTTAKATVSGCTIAENAATFAGALGGGGLYLARGNLAVSGCTISNNTAVYNGGGIKAANFASLTITKSTVAGNQTTKTNAANQGGGGVFVQGAGTTPLVPATISGCAIGSNSSAAYGGGVFVTGGVKLLVTGSIFAGDHAAGGGGGLIASGRSNSQVAASVTGSTFANDSAGHQGGGVLFFGDGPAALSSAKVIGCAANQGGGVFVEVFTGANGFTMTRSTVSGNTASGSTGAYGGGIYIDSTPDFHVSASTITNNWAGAFGGGLFVLDSGGSILGTTITGNAAEFQAGGVQQAGTGTVVLQIAKVHGNVAQSAPDTAGTFTDV